MKRHTSISKTTRTFTTDSMHQSSARDTAVAFAPPDYGIDFVDSGMAATAPVQRVAKPEEQETLRGRIGAAPAEPARAFQPPEPDRTGMPDQLKVGIEALSGMDMSGVRVHPNSDKPARIGALAYTQGNDIHLAPGQECHLPHEAWHVVQQRQGRAQATMQEKGVAINDEPALEREADEMGARAQGVDHGAVSASAGQPFGATSGNAVVQRVKWGNLALGALATVGSVGLAWASKGFRRFMRDAWYGSIRLTEEQSAAAQSGQIIEYSPLAAGCMAVTVTFVGGGGAGVHLAMMPQAPNQWANFIAAIGGNPVAQVFVDSEFVGDPEGWYVDPAAGVEPVSRAQLTFVQNLDVGQIAAAGWTCAAPAVLAWIAAQVGVGAPAVQLSQNTTPSHVMP